VRRQSLERGSHCDIERTFGGSEALVASTDRRSRFGGWRAACGTDPTCRLAVGPITAITAVLPCRSGQGSAQPGRTRALAARHLEDERAGKGRRWTILIRLQLNAPAGVTRGSCAGAARSRHARAGWRPVRRWCGSRPRSVSARRLPAAADGQRRRPDHHDRTPCAFAAVRARLRSIPRLARAVAVAVGFAATVIGL
jgi:hypothetical protein